MLDFLRKSVRAEMSEKRYIHTLEVEKMAARIGQIYLPERLHSLRAAALLHDITKERELQEHIALCERFGLEYTDAEKASPKLFHARTAAALIPEKYPEFADDDVISAVRWHTTGRADMALAEKIIYLADYIDESRKFEDCVKLRMIFWSADFSNMTEKEREAHLRDVLILSYDLTIAALADEGRPVDPSTVEARDYLIGSK